MTAWVKKLRDSAAVRVYCFAHSGGGASAFKKWPEYFPSTFDICPVHLPGREDRLREPPYVSMPALVRDLARDLPLDRPVALFGHSIGALIAFELAREWRKLGHNPPCLMMAAGCSAPDVEADEPSLSGVSDAILIDELRLLNGTPEDVLLDPELLELLLPTLRADFTLYESYQHTAEPPLDCPIAVFGGEADVRVPVDELDRWRAHTEGPFVRTMFPGDHFFIRSARDAVLSAMLSELQRAFAHLSP